jgi:hypothetical protein
MRKYFLLRNNSESGPHSLEELKNLGLLTRDLVWIEGQSRCWMNADQVEELGPWVKKLERKYPVYRPLQPCNQTAQNSVQNERVNYLNPPAFALQERQVSIEWENRFLWPTKKSREQQHPLKAMALMVVIFTGLMAGAMVIKHITAEVQTESPGNYKKEIRAISLTNQDTGNDFPKQKSKKPVELDPAIKTTSVH